VLSKHLLYLCNEQLCAYRWKGGRLTGGACFNNDRDGVDDFMDYMESHGVHAVYILADLIEEDFQRIHVPHVGGGAGRKLLRRRLLQQYRETPYRAHEIQGRESTGRRDDIVLLSALTNAASVQPWVEALEQLKMPLAGLYSTTLLSEELARRLALREEHLLLVTQQSAGWRQSYLQNGMLKFSRLTQAIDRDGQPADIGVETAKTQQFLTSVRLMARGNVLQTVVIAPEADSDDLYRQCEDGPETMFRFMALEAAAAKVGLKTGGGQASGPDADLTPPLAPTLAATLADPMLLALLGQKAPPSHYTLGTMQRYYRLWRARVSFYVISAGLAACCAVWAGINLWQYRDAIDDAVRLKTEAAQYDQRYRVVMAAMPPRVTSTANMRAAVNVERMLATQAPSPLDMVAMVSDALEQTPQIRLLQLDWKVNLPGGQPADTVVAGQNTTASAPMSSLLAGIPGKAPQALLVEAEIMAEQDDYRNAVDSMNQFAQALARHRNLTVQVEKPPLDTRSSVKLSGKAGPQAATETRAKFTLNLLWKP
jgi:hypothetical protein